MSSMIWLLLETWQENAEGNEDISYLLDNNKAFWEDCWNARRIWKEMTTKTKRFPVKEIPPTKMCRSEGKRIYRIISKSKSSTEKKSKHVKSPNVSKLLESNGENIIVLAVELFWRKCGSVVTNPSIFDELLGEICGWAMCLFNQVRWENILLE